MKDYLSHVGSTLISKEEIEKRVKQLASQINEDYKDKDNIIVVGILKGAFIFLADLIREITLDIDVEFIRVSSYASTQSSGKINLKLPYTGKTEGMNIIIVEDIVDSGLTMDYLLDFFKKSGAASVKVCCLFSKKINRTHDVDLDYVGFDLGNDFIIGYGLDYNGKFRNIPFIANYKETND